MPTTTTRDDGSPQPVRITHAAVAPGSRAARLLPRVDYGDEFRAELPPGFPADAAALARRMFGAPPRFARALVGVRDRVAGLFGWAQLGANGPPDPARMTFEPGSTFALFRVYERAPDAIVIGADDSHLDFRVLIAIETPPTPSAGGDAPRVASVATVVQFHGALGRAYFVPVRPFHRRIVRAMLRDALAPPPPRAAADAVDQ